MRIMVNDRSCLEFLEKYGLPLWIQTHVADEDIEGEVAKFSQTHQNNHDMEFHIMMEPRLLGGMLPASSSQAKRRTTKKRTKQRTIKDFLVGERDGEVCNQMPNNTSLEPNEIQIANGVDTSINTGLQPDPAQEVQQEDPHTNNTTNEDLLTRIPSLPNGDIRAAISEHVARKTFSARADATTFRRSIKEYPDTIVNTKLIPEIVDVFKAITALLTWRTINSSIIQLVWEALQQLKGYMKTNIKIPWIRVMKDNPFTLYMITKRPARINQYKAIQAEVRTQGKTPGKDIGIYRKVKGSEIEPKLTPRTHAFLIETNGGIR